MTKVREVKVLKDDPKSGVFEFVLLNASNPISPVFVVKNSTGKEWVGVLEFVLFCFANSQLVKQVGKVDLGCGSVGGVLLLSLIDGRVWSVDGSLKITEWEAKPDQTGLKKGRFTLSPARSLSLQTHFPSLLSIHFGYCFFAAGEGEIWTIFGKQAYVLNTTSALEEAQKVQGKDGGTVVMKGVEEIFMGKEEKKEEVWCGVYYAFSKHVWVGTSEGMVWRKGTKSGLVEEGGGRWS